MSENDVVGKTEEFPVDRSQSLSPENFVDLSDMERVDNDENLLLVRNDSNTSRVTNSTTTTSRGRSYKKISYSAIKSGTEEEAKDELEKCAKLGLLNGDCINESIIKTTDGKEIKNWKKILHVLVSMLRVPWRYELVKIFLTGHSKIIAFGGDIMVTDTFGRTCLHDLACFNKEDSEMCKILIGKDSDNFFESFQQKVDFILGRDKVENKSSLHYSFKNSHENICSVMLESLLSDEFRGTKKEDSLINEAQHEKSRQTFVAIMNEIIQEIQESGNSISILLKIVQDFPKVVKLLDFDTQKFVNLSLWHAVKYGSVDVCKFLINHFDPDLNVFNFQNNKSYGQAPIHVACYLLHAEIAHLLVKRGANVNLQTSNVARYTPLHVLAQSKLSNNNSNVTDKILNNICKLLLDNGAVINAVANEYKVHKIPTRILQTPFHTACYYKKYSLAETMIDYGVAIGGCVDLKDVAVYHFFKIRSITSSSFGDSFVSDTSFGSSRAIASDRNCIEYSDDESIKISQMVSMLYPWLIKIGIKPCSYAWEVTKILNSNKIYNWFDLTKKPELDEFLGKTFGKERGDIIFGAVKEELTLSKLTLKEKLSLSPSSTKVKSKLPDEKRLNKEQKEGRKNIFLELTSLLSPSHSEDELLTIATKLMSEKKFDSKDLTSFDLWMKFKPRVVEYPILDENLIKEIETKLLEKKNQEEDAKGRIASVTYSAREIRPNWNVAFDTKEQQTNSLFQFLTRIEAQEEDILICLDEYHSTDIDSPSKKKNRMEKSKNEIFSMKEEIRDKESESKEETSHIKLWKIKKDVAWQITSSLSKQNIKSWDGLDKDFNWDTEMEHKEKVMKAKKIILTAVEFESERKIYMTYSSQDNTPIQVQDRETCTLYSIIRAYINAVSQIHSQAIKVPTFDDLLNEFQSTFGKEWKSMLANGALEYDVLNKIGNPDNWKLFNEKNEILKSLLPKVGEEWIVDNGRKFWNLQDKDVPEKHKEIDKILESNFQIVLCFTLSPIRMEKFKLATSKSVSLITPVLTKESLRLDSNDQKKEKNAWLDFYKWEPIELDKKLAFQHCDTKVREENPPNLTVGHAITIRSKTKDGKYVATNSWDTNVSHGNFKFDSLEVFQPLVYDESLPVITDHQCRPTPVSRGGKEKIGRLRRLYLGCRILPVKWETKDLHPEIRRHHVSFVDLMDKIPMHLKNHHLIDRHNVIIEEPPFFEMKGKPSVYFGKDEESYVSVKRIKFFKGEDMDKIFSNYKIHFDYFEANSRPGDDKGLNGFYFLFDENGCFNLFLLQDYRHIKGYDIKKKFEEKSFSLFDEDDRKLLDWFYL